MTATTATYDHHRVVAVVDYRGSIEHEHGRYLVLSTDPDGRLYLAHEMQRTFTLSRVRPASVVETGLTVRICGVCRHDSADHRDGWCFALGDGTDGRPCECVADAIAEEG